MSRKGFSIIEKLHDKEPFFIIRAQDRHSLAILRTYASLVSSSRNHVLEKEINQIGDEFSEWQENNKHLVKDPD